MSFVESVAPGQDIAGVPSERVNAMHTIFGTPSITLDGAEKAIRNPKIAIIDDQAVNIKIVKKHLMLAGYQQFATTTESVGVLDFLRQERPDVVLLDIMMPHVSGLEILDALRRDRDFIGLPVIILTASDDRETKLEALRLGATEFLGKPIDSVELEARLRNVLMAKAHQDQVVNHAHELELQVAARSADLVCAHAMLIECLAKVGDYRDNETGEHVVRVGRYARIIARQMGLDEQTMERLGKAAQLHDIGKVGIPDAILRKPGKLTDIEFDTMRLHCKYGRDICLPGSGTSPIIAMAAVIAFTHHEKWNGKGYPSGLVGEAIPLEGRITAVADVFDALISPRPYKAPFSLEESLSILNRGRSSDFDPDVVDAFMCQLIEIQEVISELLTTQGEDSDSRTGDRIAAPSQNEELVGTESTSAGAKIKQT